MGQGITEILGFVVYSILAVFALCWAIVLGIYVLGAPGYFFDKLLKSSFGKDVLLPFKKIIGNAGKARGGSSPGIRD